jgi:excisionase family DNA binding protein
MDPETPEAFVDADQAAKFLSLTRRRILELARAGKLPGHPIGDGARRVWRFRLSELAAAVSSTEKSWFASRQKTSMVQPKVLPGAVGVEG